MQSASVSFSCTSQPNYKMSGTHSCISTPWIPWPHMLVILISWCKTIFRCLLYGLLFLFPSLKYATWWVASTTKVKSISCNPHRQPENKNDEQHLTLHTWLLNPKCSHLNIYLNSQLQSLSLPQGIKDLLHCRRGFYSKCRRNITHCSRYWIWKQWG